MLVKFEVRNFRSIKEKQALFFESDGLKTKTENTFLPPHGEFRLLKSAVVYGPNASGKSNIIRAFSAMVHLIQNSIDLKNGEEIPWYEPFQFDQKTATAPTEFLVEFFDHEGIRYQYETVYNNHKILSERLSFYPKKYRALLFHRQDKRIQLGNYFRDKRIDKRMLENHLFLSKLGNSGHEQMGEIYLYFTEIDVWNTLSKDQIRALRKQVEDAFVDPNEQNFRNKLNLLVQVADTRISGIQVNKLDNSGYAFPEKLPYAVRDKIVEQNRYHTYTFHKLFDGNKEVGEIPIHLDQESEGTKALFILGGLILRKLDRGGAIFIDELENSLHPKLCKFLVKLFHHPKSNPKNAQLVLATHETTLLDRHLLRKDQIWIIEKDKQGASELFSVSDFDKVPENAAFEQWYMNGKFGGQPNIQEIEFIFGGENEQTQ